ncbi:MAG: hypothetical protein ACI9I0_002003 [Rhodoferax sp.]|jgi:hypothetical protein
MSQEDTTQNHLQHLLKVSDFAVLATESEGQPHTSLVTITPFEGGRQLIFATYRSTRKHSNLAQNPQVSLLLDGRGAQSIDGPVGLVASALGRVREVGVTEQATLSQAHLQRHPDLADFMASADCVLLAVTIEAYQVVLGIEDATWWPVDALCPNSK